MNARWCLCVLLCSLATGAQAQSYSGAELREELGLLASVGAGTLTSKDYIRVGHVLGYINGFSDAYLQEQVRGGKPARDNMTFCLPREFTMKDLQEAAKTYLRRHNEPFLNAAPASAVLARAFREAFPCPSR